MIDARLDPFLDDGKWTYILTVKFDGVVVKREIFDNIYEAKSAQRKWWRN